MWHQGAGKRCNSKNQWQTLAAIVAMLLCTAGALSGCHSSKAYDSQAAIQEIEYDLDRGELDAAESKLSRVRRYPPANCVDCAEKLALIEAEILSLESKSKDVAALFCDGRPLKTTHLEATIKEKMFCGLAHAHLGNQPLSTREIGEAEELAQSSGSPLEGEVLQTRGRILALRGQFSDAQSSFLASLAAARKQQNKQLEAGDLLDLGFVALHNERYGEALDWFNASSQIALIIQSRALLETDLGNVGWAYYQLGDYEVALDKFLDAEKQAERLGTQVWLQNAGLCRQRLGDLAGAARDFRSALDQAEKAGNEDDVADIHVLIAILDLQSNRLGEAEAQTSEAQKVASASGYKPAQQDATLLQGLIAQREGNDTEAMRILKGAYRDSDASPSSRWKIENAIAILIARGRHPKDAEPWFRKSIATFEDQRNTVKREDLRLPFFANGDQLYRDYADFLIASKRQDEALHLLDFGRAKSMADGFDAAAHHAQFSSPKVSDPRAVAGGQNATILFYSLGADKSWLWATDARHTQLFVLPKKSEIEAHINNYQKAILKSEDPLREQNADARELYDALVAPAASMIPLGSRVIVIPDGGLNELNFETLLAPARNASGKTAPELTAPGSTGSHYWIQDVIITNAASIRLLPKSKPVLRGSRAEKTLLLMGNPVATGTEFASLPHAAAEVDAIRKQFPDKRRRVLTQGAAMPAAYRSSNPGQFSYIHFVAHGTASRLSPLDSAVVLSPSSEHPDLYKLYARDIVQQAIHADLVTISACNGSGVRSYAGEGLVGLSWAFLRAGSHNVIGALWNVDDAATPQVMDQLYRELRSGDGPDTALRDAKLSLLRSDGVYRKPLYWAAFQLYAGS